MSFGQATLEFQRQILCTYSEGLPAKIHVTRVRRKYSAHLRAHSSKRNFLGARFFVCSLGMFRGTGAKRNAFQPSAVTLETSSSVCGVPSERDLSKAIVPRGKSEKQPHANNGR